MRVHLPWRRKHQQKSLFSSLIISSIFVLSALAAITVTLNARPAQADWFDANWQYRKAITLTNSTGSAVGNLQYLLTIDTSAISTKLQSGCKDLRFTDASGTVLPYYIDSGCTGSATKVWVLINSVPTNASTIYMYYGNPYAPAMSNSGRFDNVVGLVGYWTMNEASWNGTSGEVDDVSIKGNNGTATCSACTVPSTTTGQYGRAANLNGSTQYVTASDAGLPSGSAARTVSAWIKPSAGFSGTNSIVSYGTSGTNTAANFVITPTQVGTTIGGGAQVMINDALSSGTWYYYTVTYANGGGTARVYINGSEIGNGSLSQTTTLNVMNVGRALTNAAYFNGLIDDVRVYNTARSATQIYNDYNRVYSVMTTDNSLITQSFGAEQTAPGPLAYWKFDDGTGTTAKDSSSNQIAGTLAGTTLPTWQTEDQCLNGKCLYFNGTTSNVTAGTVTGVKSISLWARPASTSASIALIQLQSSTKRDIYIQNGGSIGTDGLSSPTAYVNGVANGTVTANQWNHIEVTTGTAITADAITIGKTQQGVLKGFLDEVKLWDFQRSTDEVKADFNSKGSLVAGANVLGMSTQNQYNALNNGLVGYWKMDETSWTVNCSTATVIDSSGQGDSGRSCPSSTGPAGGATGKFVFAGSFDGSNDFVSIPANNITFSSVSMSFWMKKSANPSAQATIFGRKGFNTDLRVNIDTSGGLTAQVGGSVAPWTSSTYTTDTNWTFVTLTFNGKNNATAFYINGSLVSSGIQTGFGSSPSNTIFIGQASDTGVTGFYKGLVDEARLYNRSLSPQDIQTLYNFSPPPAAYYNFEEGSGTSLIDRSTNANTGNWSGSVPYWTTGKVGKGGNFNGTNDYVDLVSEYTTFITANEGTVSLWARPTGTAPSTSSAEDGATMFAAGNSQFGIAQANFNGTDKIWAYNYSSGNEASVGVSYTVSQWIYLTWVHSGGRLSLYANGSFIGSTVTASTDGVSLGTFIGRGWSTSGPNTLFKGKIDEVRTYKYALSQKQIIADMNSTAPISGGGAGGAVGFWKFDEGYGTTAHNTGIGGGMDGTMNNMASPATVGISGWQQSGKFGKALGFDGSNDFVSIGNPTAAQVASGAAMTAWINLNTNSTKQDILAKVGTNGNNEGYRLWVNSSGKLVMDVSMNGLQTQMATASGSTTLSTNKWYYVAGVYNPGISMTVYVNAIQDGQTTTGIPSSIFNSTANLLIGSENAGATNNFSGLIDEAKLYSYSLSPQEVDLDYTKASVIGVTALGTNTSDAKFASGSASAAYCVPGDTTACSPPIGEWDFEEGSGATVNDKSGNGNTGTWNGTGKKRFVTSNPGYGWAGNFNGSDDYVNAGNTTSEQITGALTLSGWIYLTNLSSNHNLLAKTGLSGDFGYVLRYQQSSNNFVFSVSGDGSTNTTVSTNLNPVTNHWYFVEAVYVPSTSLSIYVNGVLDNSNTTSIPASLFSSAKEVDLGADVNGSANFMSGKLDQLRIYNYARSAAQVAWEYNRGLPIGWWKLDNCQGATVSDASGNGYVGTLSIGSTTQGTCTTSSSFWGGAGGTGLGKINYAPTFDGVDDTISVGTINNLQSLAFWAKPASVSAAIGLVKLASGVDVKINNGGSVGTDGMTSPTIYVNGIVNGTLIANAWNHVVVTTGSALTANAITFGSTQQGVLSGQLDDIRFYSYPLTWVQIKNVYNDGAALRFAPITGVPTP